MYFLDHSCFNPRTHGGCDPSLLSCSRTANCFNPRTPESATRSSWHNPSDHCRFNPHTHEGCDHYHIFRVHRVTVSIHAPMKGATEAAYNAGPGRIVSIHAPMKGATIISQCNHSLINVSIHAPMKGATMDRA